MNTPLTTYLALAPQSPEAAVLRLLIELGIQVVDGQEGSLLVHDAVKNELVFAMTVGGPETLVGQRVPLDKGLTGLAAATREVQIGAPTFHVGETETQPKGPSGVIAAPMLVADHLVGVITAVTFDPSKRFSSKDGELYGRLAAVAGVVVHQRRQLDGMGERNEAKAGAESDVERRIAGALGVIGKNGGASALGHAARILGELAAMTGGGVELP